MELQGKVAIITGASSGIGEAAARLFAAQGASVVLAARRQQELERVAESIRSAGGRVQVLAGDVREPALHAAVVKLAQREFGGIDIALNNAGIIGPTVPFTETTPQQWQEVLDTNLHGAFHAAHCQVPALVARGGGALVFTSSFVGHTMGLPGMAAYAASKAALIGLVQVLAVELGPLRVRVNALLPGGTLTAMAGNDPQVHATVAAFHALKRLALPDEIAQAALFLASERSSFVTGSALLVDGGNSITKAQLPVR